MNGTGLFYFPLGIKSSIGLAPGFFCKCKLINLFVSRWDAFATEFFEDDAQLTLTFCLEDGPKRYSKFILFFYVGTPSGVQLFDHLLWSLFQSSITHYIQTIFSSSYMFHGDLLWAAFMHCIYTCLSDLWALPSFIFIEKFSPLPGSEPGTSPVLSRYATNWAILAWMM